MNYRERRLKRRLSREKQEDINPMNYVSNLSDLMLVLAVGIMLALILHWQVPVGNTEEESGESAITFSDDDLSEEGSLPENMEEVGNVYYDEETGTYYIVRGNGGGE